MCWTHTTNINNTCTLQQTTGSKDGASFICRNHNGHHNTELRT